MSQFYDNLAATAARLLATYGQVFEFTRYAPGSYDPSTGTDGAGATTTYSGNAAVFDYKSREIDGTNILQSDIRLLAERLTTVPERGDTVSIGGINYRVMRASPLAPGGVAVTYNLQLRVGGSENADELR